MAKATKKSYKGTLFQRYDIWWIQFFEKNPDGKRIRFQESLGVTTKPEAIKEAEKRTGHLLLKDEIDRESVRQKRIATANEQVAQLKKDLNRVPLANVWQRFPYNETTRGSARRQLKPRVITSNRQAWEAFARWVKETRPKLKFLEDITEADAVEYSDYCRKVAKCGPRGHNVRTDVCRVIFNHAGCQPNPFAKVRRWTETKEHRDALEMADIQKILTSAIGEERLLILIGIFTGLRLGDAVNLRWEDIRAGRIWKKTAKTGREVSLQLFPIIANELAKLPKPADGKGFILPGLAAVYERDATSVSKRIRHLFEGCGIQVAEKMKGRTKAVSRRGFHSLRTTFVSICARAGVPTGAIADWCGHSPEIDRIYQRWAGKETDARILGALGQIAAMALPAPAIDVEAVELQDLDTIRKEIIRHLESADRETLDKILAMFKDRHGVETSRRRSSKL
jgi:integrase